MSKDHFSTQSAAYANYRPGYPEALFQWIRSQAPRHEVAWDCACGSGQATRGLAACFDQVIATDLSEAQIRHAPPIANVDWRVASAEISGLATASVDVVCVAQAVHWLDLEKFWPECRRIVRPGGLVIIWSYGVPLYSDPEVARQCQQYYSETVGPYWPPERQLVEEGYRTIPFPFAELAAPAFELHREWNLAQLLGYLSSWSATERYRQATGKNPLAALEETLRPVFPDSPLELRWPIALRAGRNAE